MSSRAQQIQQLIGKLERVKQSFAEHHYRLDDRRNAAADCSVENFSQGMLPLPKPGLRQRRLLKGHLNKITSITWFQDSTRLASVAQDGKMMIWDAPTSNKLQVINLCSSWVMSLGVSPSGRLTASGGLDNLVSVYCLKKAEAESGSTGRAGPLMETQTYRQLTGHVGFISGCLFLDDQRLLSASGDQTCALWDVERGSMTSEFKGHQNDVMGVTLLDDNAFVSGAGQYARLWDIRSGQCEAYYDGHTADLSCVQAFPGGSAFASGSDDGSVRFYDIRAGRQLAVYGPIMTTGSNEPLPVTSLSFTASGKGLWASYEDSNIRLWDTYGGVETMTIKVNDKDSDRVSRLAVSPDGNALATGSWDSTIKIWA